MLNHFLCICVVGPEVVVYDHACQLHTCPGEIHKIPCSFPGAQFNTLLCFTLSRSCNVGHIDSYPQHAKVNSQLAEQSLLKKLKGQLFYMKRYNLF